MTAYGAMAWALKLLLFACSICSVLCRWIADPYHVLVVLTIRRQNRHHNHVPLTLSCWCLSNYCMCAMRAYTHTHTQPYAAVLDTHGLRMAKWQDAERNDHAKSTIRKIRWNVIICRFGCAIYHKVRPANQPSTATKKKATNGHLISVSYAWSNEL